MSEKRFCRFIFTDHDDHTVHYGVKDCQTDEFYSAEDNRNANKLLELLNNLHEENMKLKSGEKNCYNCKHSNHYEDGDSLCDKGCMNGDGYFDYEYHRFNERVVCPLWECRL